MASRLKTSYTCSECGGTTPKWQGQCPHCAQWNTLTEQMRVEKPLNRHAMWAGRATGAQALTDVAFEDLPRISTTIGEFDRVLGGGLVPGAVLLIGGEPGIGKSTLLLQTLCGLAQSGKKVLYVTGEESAGQVALRGRRLGLPLDAVRVACEVELSRISDLLAAEAPGIVVIDSIQTLYNGELHSAPGSVAQVRECAAHITRFAKSTGTTVLMVGHVTKEGELAGPRVLEHIVDAVMYFEGDKTAAFRMLRAFKNRFGAASELGVFAMTGQGLEAVDNPSALFLSESGRLAPGACVAALLEGNRPLLVEIQALVEESTTPSPRRTAVGVDPFRLPMLIAVLGRHAQLPCWGQNVYVNAVGGVSVREPAADLAMALALRSSIMEKPVQENLVAFGEIGLTGEIRPVAGAEDRVREAARLGFTTAILPAANRIKSFPKGFQVVSVRSLADAFGAIRDVRCAA